MRFSSGRGGIDHDHHLNITQRRHRDLLTLRQEFFDMPGLCLTAPQVVRLLDVPSEAADCMLTTLLQEGYLFRTTSGAYRRSYPPR